MKLHLGPLPPSPDFDPENTGWTALREPRPHVAQLFSLPFGFAAAAAFSYFWFRFAPDAPLVPDSITLSLLLLAVLVVTHELLHALAYPGFGSSERTLLGFWPRMIVFFAHHHGAMPRNRFIAVLLTPFLVLTVLPLVATLVSRVPIPYGWTFAVINALAASIDLFGVALLVRQVPKDALVRNQGWNTFWKLPVRDAPAST